MSEELPIDRLIAPTLKMIARSGPYFTQQEVVWAIMQKRGLKHSIAEIRRICPGDRFDLIIVGYIEQAVSRGLKARDEHGIRIYECYRTENGLSRWMRFRSMRATELRRTLEDTRILRDNLVAKVAFLESVLAELESTNDPSAQVEAVYAKIAKHKTLIRDDRSADAA